LTIYKQKLDSLQYTYDQSRVIPQQPMSMSTNLLKNIIACIMYITSIAGIMNQELFILHILASNIEIISPNSSNILCGSIKMDLSLFNEALCRLLPRHKVKLNGKSFNTSVLSLAVAFGI
jgi:hypothetical protein